MKVEHINPFITGVESMIKEVAGISLAVKGKSLKKTASATKNVVIMLGITGDLKGTIAINIDEEGAKKIASAMMGGMEVSTFDDISKSAVSELGNMIMGRVCTGFANDNLTIDITPPTLLTGENLRLTFGQLPIISIQFEGDSIDIDVDISIHEKAK